MEINVLTGIAVNLCVKIHTGIGPGCFEKVYEEILYYELTKLGIRVHRQVFFPIEYDDLYIPNSYKLDLIAEEKLALELKSVFPCPEFTLNRLKPN